MSEVKDPEGYTGVNKRDPNPTKARQPYPALANINDFASNGVNYIRYYSNKKPEVVVTLLAGVWVFRTKKQVCTTAYSFTQTLQIYAKKAQL